MQVRIHISPKAKQAEKARTARIKETAVRISAVCYEAGYSRADSYVPKNESVISFQEFARREITQLLEDLKDAKYAQKPS